jgi:hypothetical protein
MPEGNKIGTPGRSVTVRVRMLIVAMVLFGAAEAAEAAPDALTILGRAEAVRSPDLDYAVDFEIRVVNPASSWKERSASYTMIAHGKEFSLVLMREPRQFYPGTLLISRGLYWLLLPRSTKSFQLAPRHVLNGDISNGDLARGNLLAHYEPSLEGEDNVAGEDCWRLNLTRTNNLGMYSRIRAWITKRHFRPWRFEYFGEIGVLLKVADYRDYRRTPLGLRSMRIEVENRQRVGERTTLVFSDLRSFDASVLTFNREGMEAVRNVALARLEADGTQVRPEDLAALLESASP